MEVNKIIALTKLAVEFFEIMNIRQNPAARSEVKAENMHFVANMLLDLVEIAYPLETNEQDDFKAYKNFVNFLREDNCPRIKIPTYEQWQHWLRMAGVE